MQVNMTSPDGVTLATAGKYCTENVHIAPAFDFLKCEKHWTATITGQTSEWLTDAWLAEHRSDNELVLLIMPRTAIGSGSRCYGGICFNDPFLPVASGSHRQMYFRHSNSNKHFTSVSNPDRLDGSDTTGYRIGITEDGTLKDKSGYGLALTTFDIFAFHMKA